MPFLLHHPDGEGFARLAVITGEDTDRGAREHRGPGCGKLIGQGAEGIEKHGPKSTVQRRADGFPGKPGFPRAGGHLEHGTEAGIQNTVVDHPLLGGVQTDFVVDVHLGQVQLNT